MGPFSDKITYMGMSPLLQSTNHVGNGLTNFLRIITLAVAINQVSRFSKKSFV